MAIPGARSIRFPFRGGEEDGRHQYSYLDMPSLLVLKSRCPTRALRQYYAETEIGIESGLRFLIFTPTGERRPHAITWDSFHNDNTRRSGSTLPGRSERAGPSHNYRRRCPDTGSYIWIPSTSGIDFNKRGLLSRFPGEQPRVMDRSQETFTVPEDGNQYYVDDASNVGTSSP